MKYSTSLLALVCSASTALLGQQWQPIAGVPYHLGSAMAYDNARGNTVLFGGGVTTIGWFFYVPVMFGDTWLRSGADWQRIRPSRAPSRRTDAAMANDPLRQRVVLFGGNSWEPPYNGGLGDTWEWDGSDWHEITTAHAPAPRAGSRMVYDPSQQAILLYGGSTAGSFVQDTWYFNGTDWRVAAATAPLPAESLPNLAFCSRRGQVLGVTTQQLWPNTVATWAFSGTAWTPVATSNAPPPFHTAILDTEPSGDLALLIVQPYQTNTPTSTWRFDGTDWQALATAHTPPEQTFAVSTYDTQRQRLVARFADNTWEFDGVDWQATAIPERLSRVMQPSLAWDVLRDRLVRFGGHEAETAIPGYTADHWEWNGARWSLVPQAVAPSPRADAPMVYDRRRRCLVLQGGWSNQHLFDTWEYDGLRWRQRQLANPPTEPVRAMAYDPVRGETIAYAATDSGQLAMASTWRYDGADWQRLTTTQVPPNRRSPSFAWDEARNCGVMFGGTGNQGVYADTWEFREGDWSRRSPQTRPTAGASQASYDPVHGCVVLSTVNFNPWLTSVTWADDGTRWLELPVNNPIPQYAAYPMVYDPVRQRLLMFGLWSELWAYEPPPVPRGTKLGTGCAHGNGSAVLELVPGTLPTPGGTLALRCAPLPAQPGALWTVFGFGAASWLGAALPIDLQPLGRPDCQLWIAPAGIDQLVVHGGNAAVITLALPNAPQLAGLHLHAQALVLDAAAVAGFAGVSNAVVATPF